LGDRVRAIPLDDEIVTRADAYVRSHVESRLVGDDGDAAAVRGRLGFAADERMLLLLGQVRSDTTLSYDAPVIDSVVALAEHAAAAVRSHTGCRWRLVVKPHPKEADGRDPVFDCGYGDATYRELLACDALSDERVTVLAPNEVNVYALMDAADAALTITSQSGLEYVAWSGRPCVVVGDAFYGRNGFTVDVGDMSGVVPAIASVLHDPSPKRDVRAKALRFIGGMLDEALVNVQEPLSDRSRLRVLKALGFG
jgi:capsule polysaccharide export protein KpsC/LpsZ